MPAPPRFLNKQQLADAAREQQRMLALPLRSEYLAPSLLARAGAKPADEEAPKALHMLVEATRVECTRGTDKPEMEQVRARNSRAAFNLLHKQYRGSKWAKATRYYY